MLTDPTPARRVLPLGWRPGPTAVRYALLAAPVVLLAVMAWQRRWTADDGFINLRIVRQIQAGHGPVFNAGERVEAGTSPLWLAVLTIGDWLLPLRLEYISVLFGIVATLVGVACGALGARRVWEHASGPTAWPLPVGMVLLVALPPVWDFATSGLETGLQMAYLGVCFLLLAVRLTPQPAEDPLRPVVPTVVPTVVLTVVLPVVVLGLGPVVRPDFALFSIAFLAIWLLLGPTASWRTRLLTAAAWAAIPLAYEVFRMGFFAAVVPNTAIAKSATASWWSQGFTYLADAGRPYVLWPVLLVVLAAGARCFHREAITDRRRVAILVGGFEIVGLVHLVYVARVGGDFMHFRMVLAGVFTILLPVFVLPATILSRRLAVVVGIWAIVAMVALRTPYGTATTADGISNERAFYVAAAGSRTPVTLADYATRPPNDSFTSNWVHAGQVAHDQLHAPGWSVVSSVYGGMQLYTYAESPDPLHPLPHKVAVVMGNIGISGYAAGTDVYVADVLGLADAFAARAESTERGRPGHERRGYVWVTARATPVAAADRDAATTAAQTAYSCHALVELNTAITAPMSFGRFFDNLFAAPRLSGVRFSDDPLVAVHQLCPAR